jgi:hypothetical protein
MIETSYVTKTHTQGLRWKGKEFERIYPLRFEVDDMKFSRQTLIIKLQIIYPIILYNTRVITRCLSWYTDKVNERRRPSLALSESLTTQGDLYVSKEVSPRFSSSSCGMSFGFTVVNMRLVCSNNPSTHHGIKGQSAIDPLKLETYIREMYRKKIETCGCWRVICHFIWCRLWLVTCLSFFLWQSSRRVLSFCLWSSGKIFWVTYFSCYFEVWSGPPSFSFVASRYISYFSFV